MFSMLTDQTLFERLKIYRREHCLKTLKCLSCSSSFMQLKHGD